MSADKAGLILCLSVPLVLAVGVLAAIHVHDLLLPGVVFAWLGVAHAKITPSVFNDPASMFYAPGSFRRTHED